jgi:hypothetical protein
MKKALIELGLAQKIQFKELARVMVDADLEAVGLMSLGEGKKTLAERFDGLYH